ncbi:MAG TPA: RNA polymerase sigma-70 factor [Hanamia sp.]|nr:RNA polymerase sigma-70 factor [Hanamia sp.]
MASENSYNEQELIQLITQGDEQAFTKLFDHYRNKIYGVALKLTHSTTVAEEITEDVFLKIWLRRSALNEIENFNAYLFTIARNETYKILKQIAKKYKIVLLAENYEAISHENSEDSLIAKEYNSLLEKAIDKLPHQQKQVFQLIRQEQLKRNEVAEILHIQPETVKFHLAQAMKNIRAFCMLHLNLFIGLIIYLSFIF